MPNVKITLAKGETIESAEETLFKALKAKLDPKESFDDPAMIDLSNQIQAIYDEEYALMLQEINEALDGEYQEDWGV